MEAGVADPAGIARRAQVIVQAAGADHLAVATCPVSVPAAGAAGIATRVVDAVHLAKARETVAVVDAEDGVSLDLW